MPTSPVAELEDVHKSFGAQPALSGLDLAVAEGEIVALLGPNGAGKTTAIDILLGLRRPDRGTVRLFGADPRQPTARRRVGATPQDTGFPENLTVAELIGFVRSHYPEPRPADALLNDFGLTDFAGRRVGGLSGGQRRRIAVALAFAGNPRAVFLDEPTTGLDTAARQTLWRLAAAYAAEGGTLFLTTHYLEEAEALASRVVLIDRGVTVAAGSVSEIKAAVEIRRLSYDGPPPPPDLPGVSRHQPDGDRQTLWCRDADAAVRALVGAGLAFRNLEIAPVSLEEAVTIRLREAGTCD